MKLSHPVFALVLSVVITATVAFLSTFTFSQSIEYASLDQRFALRNALDPQKATDEVFLVGADERSEEVFGNWPFPRSIHGQLVQLLAGAEPGSIAWDVLFISPGKEVKKLPSGETFNEFSVEDATMVEGFRQFPRLITGAASGSGESVPKDTGPTQPIPLSNIRGDLSKVYSFDVAELPFSTQMLSRPDGLPTNYEFMGVSPDLLRNSHFAFVDSISAADGKRRELPMLFNYGGQIFPGLGLQAIMLQRGVHPGNVTIILGESIELHDIEGEVLLRIPIDEEGKFLINYRHPITDFNNLTYARVGELLAAKQLGAEIEHPANKEEQGLIDGLKDQIVVVAYTGLGIDTATTPLMSEEIPGVTVHLNALDSILRQDFIYRVSPWIWIPLLFAWLFVLAWALLDVNFFWLVPIGLVGILLYVGTSIGLFVLADLWLPTALPLGGLFFLFAAVTTHRYFIEDRDKRFIKTAMSAYLPSRVMANVLDDPDALRLGGTRREISVLFCDIRGFTKYCDAREPEEVVAVLNEYLDVMSEVILRYEGTIDKYIGDCIMAFWNAPDDQPDHAQRAVCCAIEMRYALANYKTQRAGIDTELFECGIGIHTGPALVGNVGATKRFNYTVIGSTVNLAARLEALTKRFTSRIIVSEPTLQQITGDFTVTSLGEVSVPGFSQRQNLYSVEAFQDIGSALQVGKAVAQQAAIQADEAQIEEPMWAPAPLPEDADIGDDREDPEQFQPKR